MPDVVLFPYLALDKRIRVGPWQLIPKKELKAEDAVDAATFTLSQQHLALYALPDRGAAITEGCGCYARPASARIGQPLNFDELRPLRLSLLGAGLMENPEQGVANPGLTVSTSENFALFAHPLNAEGSVAVTFGSMMRTNVGGIRAPDNPGYIPYPVELHLPLYNQVDRDLADALYPLLGQKTDEGRRLATTHDWLDVAWRNTDSVTSEVRVMALKAGFEVFLDVGESVEDGRAALSDLLDAPGATKRSYTYRTRQKKDRTIDLTDLEWWFTTFAFLRNKIAHGSEVPAADWQFDGRSQVMLAQRHLLEAIRKRVATATGRRDLLMDRFRRAIHRAVVEVQERLEAGEGASDGN